MSEILLGVVIILALVIGIAELCRRKLTWPKEHPGATYAIIFSLVFLFFAWIGYMDEQEEQAPGGLGELGEDPTFEQILDYMDAQRESLPEEAGDEKGPADDLTFEQMIDHMDAQGDPADP